MLALLDPEVGELEIDDHESRDSEEELSEAEESQSNPEEDEDTTKAIIETREAMLESKSLKKPPCPRSSSNTKSHPQRGNCFFNICPKGLTIEIEFWYLNLV
jgi:hypothetical protein